MKDSPARTDPEEAVIERPTPTARRLVEASVSPNTRRAYAGALRRLDAWLDGRPLHDVTLAAYLSELHDAGRASSSASMAVAAACFRATAGRAARARRRADGPDKRRVPAHRRRSGARTSTAVRDLGLGGRARHLPPVAAPWPRGRVRPGRPRAWACRCGDRGTAVHGGDAAQRGERVAPTSSIRPTATACSSPCAAARPTRRAR